MDNEGFWYWAIEDFKRHPGMTLLGCIAITILLLDFIWGC